MGHYRRVYACGHVEQCRCPGGVEQRFPYNCSRCDGRPYGSEPHTRVGDAISSSEARGGDSGGDSGLRA